MTLRKKFKNFFVLITFYVLMFQHIIPHHHHAHESDEVSVENVLDNHLQSAHNHPINEHSHEYIKSYNKDKLTNNTFKFICNYIVPLYPNIEVQKEIKFVSYKDNTFDYLLLLNYSLRAPPFQS